MPVTLNQLSIEYGGTNAQNLTDARTNLGIGGWGFNAVRNGCGLIAQEGTSFVSPSNGNYNLDGWKWVTAGTAGAVTITQDTTEVPDENDTGFLYRIPSSIKIDVTTADATVDAGDVCGIYQNIEGYLGSSLQQGATLSFWVRSPKTGVHAVTMINHGLDYTLGLTYTVNAADTWEHKTVTVPAHTTLGTWNYTTGTAILLVFSLMCGSTYWATKNSWAAGQFYGLAEAANQNIMDSTSNNFYLTDVKLTPGSYSNIEPPRDFNSELILSNRYFNMSYPYGTAPGTTNTTSIIRRTVMANSATSTANGGSSGLLFPVEMRTTPTVTIYTFDGVSGNLNYNKAGIAGAQAASTHSASAKGLTNVYTTAAIGMTTGQAVEQAFHYVADARL